MSYILDALKKAEQERDLGRVPQLGTVHDTAPRRARLLPWLVAGILLVNMAALIWWLRPEQQSDTAVPLRQAPPPAAPPQAAAATPTAPAAPPMSRPAAPEERALPVPMQPVAESAPADNVSTRATPEEPETPVAAKPVVIDAPLLNELPAEFRAAIPALSIDVHVYAPSAAARFVLINMKKYHEGDQLAEGPRIEEIIEEGLLLKYQGQLFRVTKR